MHGHIEKKRKYCFDSIEMQGKEVSQDHKKNSLWESCTVPGTHLFAREFSPKFS